VNDIRRAGAELALESGEVVAPDVLGKRRKDVVPDRREAAGQLRESRGARHEPPVEVLAPVTPTTDVHAPDLPDRPYRAIDSRDQHAELGGECVGKVSGLGVVHPGLEQRDERQAGRTVERPEAPALRRPEALVVAEVAAAAVDAALAVPRRLVLGRREQGPRSQVAGERERVPLLDGRHSQRARGAGVELLGRLGHETDDARHRGSCGAARRLGGPSRSERIGRCRSTTS